MNGVKTSTHQTGVKSAGWLNRMAHFPFFHSWNESKLPCVVSIAKSGTMLPKRIPPSVESSGYRLIYVLVPVSIVSIVDIDRRDGKDVEPAPVEDADERDEMREPLR